MRCPYCGGLNPENSSSCVRCGRGFAPQQSAPVQSPTANSSRSGYPPPQFQSSNTPNPQRTVYPPVQQTRPATQQGRPTVVPQPPRPPIAPQARPVSQPAKRPLPKDQISNWHVEPTVPSANDPPAPFPPKTFAQLKQLEPGALDYTIIDDEGGYGKKKIVSIAFRRCVPWQQVATLLRAFNEYDNAKFDTVTIQAVHTQEAREIYEYTNGQLIFDRNVRLGSQTMDRFRIETDNGYSTEALRIVLSE